MSRVRLGKYILPVLLLSVLSCSIQTTSDQKDSSNINLVSTDKTIEPTTISGETFLNLRHGDSNLIFNLNITAQDKKNFTGDGAPAFATKADTSSDTKLNKISNEITVNSDKYKFDIPSDKINSNNHKVTLTGLKKDDVVSYDGKAYDDKGNEVGSQSVKDKKVDKDIDTVDVNFSISININVSQTTVVNATQTQTVTGPTINITLPSPPQNNNQNPNNQPNTTSQSNSSSCLAAPPPEHTATLSDGTKIRVCTPEDTDPSQKCYKMDANNNVKLEDGRTFQICDPRQN